jgi:hypothetical protein
MCSGSKNQVGIEKVLEKTVMVVFKSSDYEVLRMLAREMWGEDRQGNWQSTSWDAELFYHGDMGGSFLKIDSITDNIMYFRLEAGSFTGGGELQNGEFVGKVLANSIIRTKSKLASCRMRGKSIIVET